MPNSHLENFPFGTIDHQRDFGDFGFVSDEIEEGAHGGGAIEHAFVHVNVDHVCSTVDLRFRNANRIFEFSLFDQSSKLLRAGHVRALADHDKRIVLAEDEGLVARILG